MGFADQSGADTWLPNLDRLLGDIPGDLVAVQACAYSTAVVEHLIQVPPLVAVSDGCPRAALAALASCVNTEDDNVQGLPLAMLLNRHCMTKE